MQHSSAAQKCLKHFGRQTRWELAGQSWQLHRSSYLLPRHSQSVVRLGSNILVAKRWMLMFCALTPWVTLLTQLSVNHTTSCLGNFLSDIEYKLLEWRLRQVERKKREKHPFEKQRLPSWCTARPSTRSQSLVLIELYTTYG